jgi:hypothetical protein
VRRWNRVCSQKCRGIGRRDVRARAAKMVESGDTRAHVCVDFVITKMPGTMTEYEWSHRAGPRRYDCVHFVMNFGFFCWPYNRRGRSRQSGHKGQPRKASSNSLFIFDTLYHISQARTPAPQPPTLLFKATKYVDATPNLVSGLLTFNYAGFKKALVHRVPVLGTMNSCWSGCS